jgi:mannose-6-phosphate isomerase-like protein (cupin superfamily)
MNRVEKPWGYYKDVVRKNNVVFKEIVVFEDQELSYQSHEKREEFWFISKGVGSLTLEGISFDVAQGSSFVINKKIKHKIKNCGAGNLHIYEMQCGVCDENDIVRYSDKYGRSCAP